MTFFVSQGETMIRKLLAALLVVWAPAALVAGVGLLAAPAAANEDEGNTIHRTRPRSQRGSRDFLITTVSTRSDLVSGGDVLVQVDVSLQIPLDEVEVLLNGQDVTAAFDEQGPATHALLGLVTGLRDGDNLLEVRQQGRLGPSSFLELTNYPITGPILSGPHLRPYECRTAQSGLGVPLDADCSAASRIDWFYRASNNTFKPLADPMGPPPADLVFTTTSDGMTVPYIVRVESGTNNRSIYRIAMLDQGWNRKLVVSFGGGCDSRYNQGVNQVTNALSHNELSRGFAFMISTELVNNQHCNAALQGEAMMMLKEHFIEEHGAPKWTLGLGGSGGAIQQYLIAEMFPGLLDGLQPSLSFPDSELVSVLECRLLQAVYAADPVTWTSGKQDAVNGYAPTTCESWASSFANTNVATHGVGNPPCGLLDQSLVYDPVTNPNGARCSVADMRANIYGRDRLTGFGLSTEDNVGVQYGLSALNRGEISVTEFLDLNERVGGFDIDGNIVPQRSVADRRALERAYLSGLVNQFENLGSLPIVTQRVYVDQLANNAQNIHDRAEDFVVRARLSRAQDGRVDNQIIWTAGLTGTNLAVLSLELMNRWLDAIAADPAPPGLDKVARTRPADAADACFDATGHRIVEPATYDGPGVCNTLYPNHSMPRLSAGMPLTNDIKKCQLKPIDSGDYAVPFTPSEAARLRTIFPEGVCDYSRPGVGQRPLEGTYLRFGKVVGDDEP